MRNNERRNTLTRARLNFSQSETSSLLRGGGGGLHFELQLGRGGQQKRCENALISANFGR